MFVAGEEDRGLQAFVQYAYPAEGGSQIAFAERPGLAGYGGCVTVTLRYDRRARRATGYFEVDKDSGVTNIATLTQLSPRLGSRPNSERKFVNPYIGTDVFAGVVAAAGFDAKAGKPATEWCFSKFRVWTLGAKKAKDVLGRCPANLQLSGCCSPRCEPCEGEPNKLAGTKSAAGGAVAFSPLRRFSVRGGKCGPRDKAGALTGFTFMDLHRPVKDDDFAKYYDPTALELTGSDRLCVDAAPPYAPGPGGGLVKNALLVGLPPVTRPDLLTASVDLCDLKVPEARGGQYGALVFGTNRGDGTIQKSFLKVGLVFPGGAFFQDQGVQAFVQYEFPAEGGSALELSPVPGVGPGGYEGCIRLTLRYNRATRRATGFFARDIDGGRPTTIGTIRGVSAKLGSRKNPINPSTGKPRANAAVKTDVFAGVLASAGVAGGAAATHRWCFRGFAVQISDGADVPEVWQPPPSNEPGWIPPDPNSSTPPTPPTPPPPPPPPTAVCTCANGVGATGAACPFDGAAVCAACDPGYALVAFGTCR